MKVGLVGFGMVAERFHAPLLTVEPEFTLTHVVERSGRRAQELYPGIATLSSAQELWASEVDVVVILTPNESHFPMAREALLAGKHVVVDKPFTITSAEADVLAALALKAERTLTVFHNRRWDNDFLTIRELLGQGRLGTLHRYESRWERFRPHAKGGWREDEGQGRGVLYDLGSHMIDQALVLFGKPARIFAHLQVQREGVSAVDCFDLVADYGNLQVHLSASCLCAVPSFRFLLQGEAGSYRKDGLDPQEDALAAGVLPGSPAWGEEPPERWGTLWTRQSEDIVEERWASEPGDYGQFYRNLAATLRGDEGLSVKAQEARDVIRAIELAETSHEKGGWVAWS